MTNQVCVSLLFFGLARSTPSDLGAKFVSKRQSKMADRISAVLPLLISELFEPDIETFIVTHVLEDDTYELGEILGVRLERNSIAKITDYVEFVLPALPDVLFRQCFGMSRKTMEEFK